MRIRKIEVPAFRVLRDMVMEFPAGISPQVFPIASENGGGKSTLLQLLFTLLHCGVDEARHPYLQAMVSSMSYDPAVAEALVARISVELDGKERTLKFISLGSDFLKRLVPDDKKLRFGLKSILSRKGMSLEKLENELESYGSLPDVEQHDLALLKRKIRYEENDLRSLWRAHDRTRNILLAIEMAPLVDHMADPSVEDWRALVCKIDGETVESVRNILEDVAERISLLGPESQQYLFLPVEARRSLLRESPYLYLQQVSKAMEVLPAFQLLDWAGVRLLKDALDGAKLRDSKEIEKTGSWGTHYPEMLHQLASFVRCERARPQSDKNGNLTGILFEAEGPDQTTITLGLEDLSRGQLKRLSLFAWLKANEARDGVVLIDEPEVSFHPDWQVGLPRDLHDWGPGNQYLLATHSYELCQLLTPGHVRVLEPQLQLGGDENHGD